MQEPDAAATPGPVAVDDVAVGDARLRVLSLQRPGARNAMDTGLLAALLDALQAAASDDGLRGLVLTGSGGSFSAGADVRERTPDGGRRRMELFTACYEQLTLFPLPTAAAVEGYAVGGGAEAAGACDLRVVAQGAVLRFPGAIYGVPVGVARTVGQVGLSTAKDWVLSSRDVPAEEAWRTGFAQRLVADGQARDEALAWLTTVADRDAATVRVLKRLFNEQGGVRDRLAFENDALRVHAETGRLPGEEPADLPRTVRPRRR